MATLQNVITDAGLVLNDVSNVRWTTTELTSWGNAGIREIVALDPPAYQEHRTLTLVAGALQELPDDAMILLDVVGNITSLNAAGKQIRMCDRADLDARFPLWQTEAVKDTILNVMYDQKDRKIFWTYPPAAAGTKIEVVVSVEPADIIISASLPLDIQYRNPLLDYILYRAFSKESEQQANGARAVAHYTAFTQGIQAIISNRMGGSSQKE